MEPRQTQSVVVGDEPIIDVKAASNFLGYLLRSTRRRRRTVISTIVVTLTLVGVLCKVLPRVYKVSTRILTHKSLTMNAIINPERAVPQAADAPTSGAVELIKSRENLENLMNDIKLREVWEAKRSPLGKLRDRARVAVLGPPSEADVHEAFLKMVDEALTPHVEGEVVLMDVEWADADIAMSMADGAVARFLKLRHDMELSEILETVNILERNVESSRKGIEDAVTRMQKVFNEKEREIEGRPSSKAAPPRSHHKSRVVAIRRPAGADAADSGMDELRRSLADKQAALTSLKRGYEARVKKAEETLANNRASLGPEHPDVAEAKRNLEALATPPAEMASLQADIVKLEEQARVAPGSVPTTPALTVRPSSAASDSSESDMMRVPVSDELYQELETDPEIASVIDELKKREDAHDSLIRRLASARIESETATAAFDYRYIMTLPPVYPKKYIKPNLPVLAIGGAVMAVILGVAFAVISDVLSRRILETWQLESFLKLKVLGEIEEPKA